MSTLGGKTVLPGHKAIVAALVLFAFGPPAFAHETDQFTVPAGRAFGDLRHYFSAYIHDVLNSAVDEANAKIRQTLNDGNPTLATAEAQQPQTVANIFMMRFPPAVLQIEGLQLMLHEPDFAARYPGVVSAYMAPFVIYHNPAVAMDVTKFWRLFRTSTIMIDGVYLGTDKIDHFVHVGHAYWRSYQSALKSGATEAEAVQQAIKTGTGADPLFSERTVLGLFVTGVISNGDLAANYAGFKFYRNLTEEIVLAGKVRPPILVREGHYWRINDHVHPRSDFFTVFVSDHWDEALNPCLYPPVVGDAIRDEIVRRCDDLKAWYTDREGRPRSREALWATLVELSTWYGEDYGHTSDLEKLVNIADVCFEEQETEADEMPGDATGGRGGQAQLAATEGAVVADVLARDVCGRTSLWWAAADGQTERVRQLLSSGADVNAADVDGEVPLHAAARWGHLDTIVALLEAGGDANAATVYGTRPLHLAVREVHHGVAAALIEAGALVNAADMFGCTPLHDVATMGDDRMAALLDRHGANPLARDREGVTPLQRAERNGHAEIVALWIASITGRSTTDRRPGGVAAGEKGR